MKDKIIALLNSNVQHFINNNLDKNLSDLALKYKDVDGVAISEIIFQIHGKQKAKSKLPSWFSTPGILFPPTLNLEQSSSEITADYKSKIIKGKTLLDLTGGFGIDTTAFAKKFERVIYIERNKDLLEIVQHNLQVFEINNVTQFNAEAEEYLQKSEQVDCIYIDPARRDSQNKKVFKLTDCEPNVVQLLPILFSKTNQILIKTSPILDLKSSLKELKHVAEVYVVAVENECKEVLYLLNKQEIEEPQITTVNIQVNAEQRYTFDFLAEEAYNAIIHEPLKYLYEPNAAILKAGAFNSVARSFNLFKLHPNSHLYTSDVFIEDFPGRKFEIIGLSRYDKKGVNEWTKSSKANITVRNFPDSVNQIRNKLKLKEGGEIYLFATTDLNNKPIILITKKANKI